MMINLYINWEEIPESSTLYLLHLESGSKELSIIQTLHGLYLGPDNEPEVDEKLMWLHAWLQEAEQQQAKIWERTESLTPNPGDPIGVFKSGFYIQCGQLL